MKRKPLTTLAAADIGREMGVRGLIVHRDPADRALWQVVTPGRCETHEPMDEKAWRAFLAASGWIDRPARYDAGHGRKVTVPEDPSGEDALAEALRANLSPQAVAVIAAYLQPVRTMDEQVLRELQWFSDVLTATVGGDDELNRLCEEVGL